MNSRTRLALAAVMLCSALPVSIFAAIPQPQATSPAMATVNGEPITQKEMVALFTDRHSGHAKFLGGDAEARAFLNLVIDDRVLLQEAYELGLDADPEVSDAVNDLIREKTVKYLVIEEIDKKAVPTEDEVKAIWQQQFDKVLQARQIAVATRQEAEELRAALLSGADFEALARTCSLAETGKNGGHLMTNWGKQEPAWEEAVAPLQPGELSPVIETYDGFEVVIPDYVFEVERPDYAKAADEIRATLNKRKTEARRKAWSAELWSKYGVTLEPLELTPASVLKLVQTAPDTVVARWKGDGKITISEVFSPSEARTLVSVLPNTAKNEIASRIRATVNEPLVALEAGERKIAEVPVLAEEISKYRETMMKKLLFRDHIYKDLKVDGAEVAKYYDEHKTEFLEPEQRHVAQILVATEADAKAVKQKLAAGAKFEDVAKKSSRDFATALSGGDLGWITPEKVPAAFKEILTLKEGQSSKPIPFQGAWRIIKVLEIKLPRQQPLDEVKDKVEKAALGQKQQEARKFWVDKLRAAATIEISDAAIKQFVAENQFDEKAPAPQHAIPVGGMNSDHGTVPTTPPNP